MCSYILEILVPNFFVCLLCWGVWCMSAQQQWRNVHLTISFPSLTFHAVTLLLWKSKLYLTSFKIITLRRPSALCRMFFIGHRDLPLRERLGGLTPYAKNFESLSSVGFDPSPKNWVLRLSFMSHPNHPLIKEYILDKRSP